MSTSYAAETPSEQSEKKIHAVHDLFFRKTMSNPRVALEFFETHLPPEIFQHLDSGSLEITKETFIDANLDESITDILYQSSFHGKAGYVYLLVEHQRTPDELMAFRLLEYMARIGRMHWDKGNNKLPVIYPCVIYNGVTRYQCATNVFDLCENPEMMRKIIFEGFKLIDLSQFSDNDLKKKPLLGIVEMLLKHAYTRDFLNLAQNALIEMIQVVGEKKEFEILKTALSYLLNTQENKMIILETFQKGLSQETQSQVMTAAQQLKQEGRQEGQSSLLSKLLNHRFPRSVTRKYLTLIKNADGETLSIWGERLLDATSIEEVFSGSPLRS